MSSKFSGIPKTQKPPAVCKKPPVPDTIPLPPFVEKIFQGYAEWYDVLGTDQVALTGTLELLPDSANPTWSGDVAGKPYSLRVFMEYHDALEAFDYTVTLLLNGFPAGAYQERLLAARSLDPFDSGLINFVPSGGQTRIHCRIMS